MYRGDRPHQAAALTAGRRSPRPWACRQSASSRSAMRGRHTGRLRSFPVVVADYQGERYLVAMLGSGTNWTRNVQAAGGRVLLGHGRPEAVRLEAVDPSARVPILKRSLQAAPGARPHIPSIGARPWRSSNRSPRSTLSSAFAPTRPSLNDPRHPRGDGPSGPTPYHYYLSPPLYITKMKRVVVDHYGGPEVLRVVEDDVPEPGPGEVRVRVLAAGVSYTDAMLRAGTYLGVPKPPFTPGYELVGVVEELGPGCSRLRGRPHRRADGVGRRRGARLRSGGERGRGARGHRPGGGREPRLHLHDRLPAAAPHGQGQARRDGARARGGRQGGHRGARARSGRGASHVRDLFRARPGRGRAARRGGDRLPQRGLPGAGARAPGEGVDVVLDGLGGKLSLRSFRALRPGGRLVVYGHSSTISHGHKSWRGWIEWYAATATVALWGLLSPRRRVSAYRIQKLREGHQVLPMGSRRPLPVGGGPRDPEWFRRTSARCSSCS